MSKLLTEVYLNNEVRIQKDGDKYFVETSINDIETSTEIDFNALSRLSRNIALMVYEHHNPDHYDIQPCGFSKNLL